MLHALQQYVGDGRIRLYLADPCLEDPSELGEESAAGPTWTTILPAQLKELCDAYAANKDSNKRVFSRFDKGIPIIGYKKEGDDKVITFEFN